MIKVPSITFGDIEIDDHKVYQFDKGIPGLRGIHKYAIVEAEDTEPVKWLQALQPPYITLMMLDPAIVDSDYSVNLTDEHLKILGNPTMQEVFLMVLIVVPEDAHNMTANLLAPLVFNLAARKALQVVVEGSPEMLRVKVIKD